MKNIFKNVLIDIDTDIDIFKYGLLDFDLIFSRMVILILIWLSDISNTPTWPSPDKSQGKAKGVGKKKARRACKTIGEESGKGVAEVQGKNRIHWIDLYIILSWLNSFLISNPKLTTWLILIHRSLRRRLTDGCLVELLTHSSIINTLPQNTQLTLFFM